jgi:hypothetical protein
MEEQRRDPVNRKTAREKDSSKKIGNVLGDEMRSVEGKGGGKGSTRAIEREKYGSYSYANTKRNASMPSLKRVASPSNGLSLFSIPSGAKRHHVLSIERACQARGVKFNP